VYSHRDRRAIDQLLTVAEIAHTGGGKIRSQIALGFPSVETTLPILFRPAAAAAATRPPPANRLRPGPEIQRSRDFVQSRAASADIAERNRARGSSGALVRYVIIRGPAVHLISAGPGRELIIGACFRAGFRIAVSP